MNYEGQTVKVDLDQLTVRLIGMDGQLLASFTNPHDGCYTYQMEADQQYSQFVAWITKRFGQDVCDIFYTQYVHVDGPSTITKSGIGEDLHIDKPSAQEFVRVGTQYGVIERYYSDWKLKRPAKVGLNRVMMGEPATPQYDPSINTPPMENTTPTFEELMHSELQGLDSTEKPELPRKPRTRRTRAAHHNTKKKPKKNSKR